ncbi:unnamed protein product [Sphagnum balticum]
MNRHQPSTQEGEEEEEPEQEEKQDLKDLVEKRDLELSSSLDSSRIFRVQSRRRACDVMVHALENEHIRFIFGIPGEENLALLDSLRGSSIRMVITRHEQAAGFMAATMGRLTGKAGLCFSTLGPGALNLATAAAYAQLAGFPMLMITGQKPIRTSKQGSFQIIDVVDAMRPITKFTKQIADGDLVPSMVREAIRVAEEERPGAVHLELPEDIASTMTNAQAFPVYPVRRPIAEGKAIAKAADLIHASSHPLLLIGAGANRQHTQKMLLEFVDQLQIPFVTTQMGKGVINEAHPLYLGCCALSAKDYVHVCIEKADLIINIGHDVVEKPPFFMQHGKAPMVIHVNFYTAKVDNIYFPQLEVVGDIANAVWQLKNALQQQQHWNYSFMMQVKADLEEHIGKGANDTRFPLTPQRVVSDLRKVMPADGIVCLDNGMFKVWFARCYKAYEPNTLLLDNSLATMGAGLPSAAAACLLHPEKKVVAVCGDGGFMLNSQEMETAVRLDINLTIVVLNDNGFGMIKWKQNAGGYSMFGLDLKNPNFVAYANSYGAKGYCVRSANELSWMLHDCIFGSTSGVKLIEVPLDYTWANQILDHELPGLIKKRQSMSEAESRISPALFMAVNSSTTMSDSLLQPMSIPTMINEKACGSSEEEAVSMENRAAEVEVEDLASTAVCDPLCSRTACTTEAVVGVSYVSSPMCPSDRPDCVCFTNVQLECSECGRSYPM